MADEESIQLELLAQLEELNRISIAVSPHPVVSAPCVQAAGGSVCVHCTKRWGSFLRVGDGAGGEACSQMLCAAEPGRCPDVCSDYGTYTT
jgi:hypothetical protein